MLSLRPWTSSTTPGNLSSIIVSNWINSEALCEDETFPERELAALVVSKVYYQLGVYDESMVFALSAGKLFDIDHPNEYEDTIICMTSLLRTATF
jgi:hypothetical protein